MAEDILQNIDTTYILTIESYQDDKKLSVTRAVIDKEEYNKIIHVLLDD